MSEKRIYTNPSRNNPEMHERYVPHYQTLGIVPQEGGFANNIVGSEASPQKDVRPALKMQSTSQPLTSPIGRGRGGLPNVGNNMEQSWSGFDDQLIDDVFLDPQAHMIDNNDIVSDRALGISTASVEVPKDTFTAETVINQNPTQTYAPTISQDLSLGKILHDLEPQEYIILVQGVPVISGTLELVREHADKLLFGEGEYDQPVPAEEIMILKKMKLKFGVFVE